MTASNEPVTPRHRLAALVAVLTLLLSACSWIEAEPEPQAAEPARTPTATPRPTPRPTATPEPDDPVDAAPATGSDEDEPEDSASRDDPETATEATPEGPRAPEEELVIGTAADVGSWDPMEAGPTSATYYAGFYETLVNFRFGFPQPSLARSWEFDEEGVEFRLQGNVTFHDGTPLDANAVVFNLQRLLGLPGSMSAELAPVTSVEAIDERTVRIGLSSTTPSLFWALADPRASIVSPFGVANLADGPVGTGPFQYVAAESETGVRVVGEWWDGYRDRNAVHFGKITYSVFPSPSERLAAFQAGFIDIATTGAIDAAGYQSSGAEIASLDLGGTALVFIDRGPDGTLASSDIRRAIAHAVDRDALAAALGASGQPRSSTYRDGNYGDGSFGIDYAPGEAEALASPFGELELTMPTTSALGSAPALLQAQLAEAGISLELVDLEAPPPTPEPTPPPTPTPEPQLDENGEPIPTPIPEPTPPPTPTPPPPPPLPPDLDSACSTTAFSLCFIDLGLIHPFELYQRFWSSAGTWNPAGAVSPDVDQLAGSALAEPDPVQSEVFWSDMTIVAEERDVLLTFVAGDELPIAYDPLELISVEPVLGGNGAVLITNLQPVRPPDDETDADTN